MQLAWKRVLGGWGRDCVAVEGKPCLILCLQLVFYCLFPKPAMVTPVRGPPTRGSYRLAHLRRDQFKPSQVKFNWNPTCSLVSW